MCPYCGKAVGRFGNWLARIVGTGLHDCDRKRWDEAFYGWYDEHGMTVSQSSENSLPESIEIDEDGYPDEGDLDQITEANAVGHGAVWMVETFPSIARTIPCCQCEVSETFCDPGRGRSKRIVFTTGGWGGAEDLVEAVLSNDMLRVRFYAEWRRGGMHVFEVPLCDVEAEKQHV